MAEAHTEATPLRERCRRVRALNVPNWQSSTDRVTVTFSDFLQDITTWGECKRLQPSPCA